MEISRSPRVKYYHRSLSFVSFESDASNPPGSFGTISGKNILRPIPTMLRNSSATLAVWAMVSIASAFNRPPLVIIHKPFGLPAALFLAQESSPSSETNNQTSFSLEQDWTLIDAVPQYTVLSESKRNTFWNQLSVRVPKLSHFSTRELQIRYEELSHQGNNTQLIPPSGPQPPVLDNWAYSEDKRTLWGNLDSGVTLRVTVSTRGWLADDPLAGANSDDRRGGGYVVALGGEVYELGVPTTEAEASSTAVTPFLTPMKQQLSRFSGNLAAMLVVVAGLSASLGFVAGSGSTFSVPAPSSTLVTVAKPTTEKYIPDSIAERRVLQERRIEGRELQLVREKEAIVRIRSKIRVDQALLDKDKEGLEKLRTLQAKTGGNVYVIDLNLGSTSPTTTNPSDLRLSELQARQERKVTGLELQLVREREKIVTIESKIRVQTAVLERDRAGLKELRKLEAEKGGEAIVKGQLL